MKSDKQRAISLTRREALRLGAGTLLSTAVAARTQAAEVDATGQNTARGPDNPLPKASVVWHMKPHEAGEIYPLDFEEPSAASLRSAATKLIAEGSWGRVGWNRDSIPYSIPQAVEHPDTTAGLPRLPGIPGIRYSGANQGRQAAISLLGKKETRDSRQFAALACCPRHSAPSRGSPASY